MQLSASSLATSQGPARRRGFSFAEVLFAVVILGIGFIMIAAIFPVAISQTRANSEESYVAALTRSGASYLQSFASDTIFRATDPLVPPTIAEVPSDGRRTLRRGIVVSMRDLRLTPALRNFLWSQVSGTMISPADPRHAYVPLYRRDVTYQNVNGTVTAIPSPYAQLIVIGVASRNASIFLPVDTANPVGALAPAEPFVYNLQPRHIRIVSLTPGPAGGIDTITLGAFASGNANEHPGALNAVSTGMFIVVSDDNISPIPGAANPRAASRGLAHGRVYRLGNELTGSGGNRVFELAPGYGAIPSAGPDGVFGTADDLRIVDAGADGKTGTTDDILTLTDAVGLFIGRGLTDPTSVSSGFEGAVMDVTVYTTWIKVN